MLILMIITIICVVIIIGIFTEHPFPTLVTLVFSIVLPCISFIHGANSGHIVSEKELDYNKIYVVLSHFQDPLSGRNLVVITSEKDTVIVTDLSVEPGIKRFLLEQRSINNSWTISVKPLND